MSYPHVFMEHNPINALTIPSQPINASNFMLRIVHYPRSPYSTGPNLRVRYLPIPDTNRFHIKIGGTLETPEVEFYGRWFANQETLDIYLNARGITLRRELSNFDAIRRYTGRHQNHLILIEEMKYTGTSNLSMIWVKNLLNVGKLDFVSVKQFTFLHTRTGDPIPKNEFVPLFRPGHLSPRPETPIHETLTMENSSYVIL